MTPKSIVNAIEAKVGVSGTPRQLRDLIESELLENGLDVATAAEKVDSLRAKVTAEIEKRRDERDEMGEIAILHLSGSMKDIIHGSSYIFHDDPAEVRIAKHNRVFVDEIQSYINNLNFTQFERFGRSVLRELGCSTAKVTPHAGDQGIDFYGELSVGSLVGADPSILKLMHEAKVILVWQAKHYPNTTIGPSVVRELVGALSLSRTNTYSKRNLDLLNDVELRPFFPVLALLFSTGAFSKGARYLAGRAGLIAFSGWQLAVFLADKGVGLVENDGNIVFDSAVFDDWLT